MPEAQLVHDEAAKTAYVPEGQLEQTVLFDAPRAAEEVPTGHAVHVDAPVFIW